MNRINHFIISVVLAFSLAFTAIPYVHGENVYAAESILVLQPEEDSLNAAICLNKSKANVQIGKTLSLYLLNCPKQSELLSVKSANTKIVTIKKKGKKAVVTGKKAGETKVYITYRYAGKKHKYTCKITVPKPGLSSSSKKIVVGGNANVSLKNAGTQKVKLIKLTVLDKSIAQVTKKGTGFTVKGRKVGKTVITATYQIGSVKKNFKCNVQVAAKPVTVTPTPTPLPTPTTPPLTECKHKYIVDKKYEASCEKSGYTSMRCSLCDDILFKDMTNPKGHDYVNGECRRCSAKEVSNPITEHKFDEPISVEPTCTTQGYICHKCIDGDFEYKSDYTDCLGHDFTGIDERADTLVSVATCDKGSIYRYVCRRCNMIGDESYEKDDKLEHIFNQTDSLESTCESHGCITTECARCGLVNETELPLAEHELSIVGCKDEKVYYECVNCKKLLAMAYGEASDIRERYIGTANSFDGEINLEEGIETRGYSVNRTDNLRADDYVTEQTVDIKIADEIIESCHLEGFCWVYCGQDQNEDNPAAKIETKDWKREYQLLANQNGRYYLYGKDNVGEIKNFGYITINNIDDEQPDIIRSINEKGEMSFKISDARSGIGSMQMIFPGEESLDITGEVIIEDDNLIYSLDEKNCPVNGIYTILATDNCNNSYSVDFLVCTNIPDQSKMKEISRTLLEGTESEISRTVIDKADCTTPGLERIVVNTDGQISVFDNEIPAVGHNKLINSKENEILPECESEGGYDSVKRCERCGEIIEREHIVTAPLGHSFNKRPTVIYHSGSLSAQNTEDYREYAYYECENGCKSRSNMKYYITIQSDEGVDLVYSSATLSKAGEKESVEAIVKPYYTFDGWYCDGKKISSDAEYIFTMEEGAGHFEARTTPNILFNRNVTYKTDYLSGKRDNCEDKNKIKEDHTCVDTVIDKEDIYKEYSIDVAANVPGARIYYSMDSDCDKSPEDMDYIEVNPKISVPGEHLIHYKICKDGWRSFYGQSYIRIGKAEPICTVSTEDWIYDETPSEVSADTTGYFAYDKTENESALWPIITYYKDEKCSRKTDAEDIVVSADSDDIVAGECPTEAGRYYVKAEFPATDVFEKGEAVTGFEIKKAHTGLSLEPVQRRLVYNGTDKNNGSEQTLISAGKLEEGKVIKSTGIIEYKVDDGEYSDELPGGINAGNYNISYKIVPDNNHYADENEHHITARIDKAEGSLSLSETEGDTCISSKLDFTITDNKSAGSISVKSSSDGVTVSRQDNKISISGNKAAGAASIVITSAETDNYKSSSVVYTAQFKEHEEYKAKGGTVRDAPTCTAKGTRYYVCGKCKKNLEIYYQDAASLGHTGNSGWVGKNATYCYMTCTRCNETYGDITHYYSNILCNGPLRTEVQINTGIEKSYCTVCNRSSGGTKCQNINHKCSRCGYIMY